MRTFRRLCVFCGSSPGVRPEYRAAAAQVGRLLVTTVVVGPQNHRNHRVPGPHPVTSEQFSARADSAPKPQG